MHENSFNTTSQMWGKIPILFSDGECQMCNFCVRFILANERNSDLHFSYLKSPFTKRFIDSELSSVDSLILWRDGKFLTKSSAALGILSFLKWPWQFLRILYLIPKSLRDKVYDHIAKRRIQWFGARSTCYFPNSTSEKLRFIDSSS
jgi:predicted DCC family thiol-disulfide oxidoreductase YuxK